MTKKTREIIKKGLTGSIKEQSKLFNQNFITKILYRGAVKRGASIKY